MRLTMTFLSVWLLLCTGSTNHADKQSWSIDTRVVPVPAGASQELQEAIRNSPKPDISSRQEVPTSDAQWLARYGKMDQANAARYRSMNDRFAVEVKHDEINGVRVHRITPARIVAANEDRLFIYLHGGMYVFGSGDAGIAEAILISSRVAIPVLSIDYRMPPTHPFPAAIDDVVSVYEYLLKTRSAKSMAIGGSSAGGELALAAVHQFQALNLQTPGAIYAGSAWADLTKTGDTLFTNEGLDRLLVTYDGRLGAAAQLYADDHNMKDPLISPVYGDFYAFPPTILITGTRDLFLSDVARTHRKLRAAHVIADLHVYEGMSHAGYVTVPGTPESIDIYNEVNAFIAEHLD